MSFDLWKEKRERAEDLGVLKVLYEETKDGEPIAYVWTPKAINPYAHYRFSSVERRAQYIAEQAKNMKAHKERVAEARKERSDYKHNVKVGDVFVCSWGYDQTNIDFYQVAEVKGRQVVIRQITSRLVNGEEGFMQGRSIPNKNNFKGEPMSKLVQSGYENRPSLKIESYAWASLWDGKPEWCSWYA